MFSPITVAGMSVRPLSSRMGAPLASRKATRPLARSTRAFSFAVESVAAPPAWTKSNGAPSHFFGCAARLLRTKNDSFFA